MKLKKIFSKLPWIGKASKTPVVPVVRLVGTIGVQAGLGKSMSMATVAEPLEQAFDVKGAKAVALIINSPGGSPVQSTLIFKRIRALSEEKGIPVFAFAEDAAASGGYMLAIAADEIFADASSVIGSIGVISAGFGFHELIEKIGVERRVYTSGESKSTLDSFKPEVPEDVARLKSLQEDIHTVFKDMVKDRRGDLLNNEDGRLFTGEFWTGFQAEKLGLIDGIGDVRSVMRERFGDKVELQVIGGQTSWLKRKTGFGDGSLGFGGFSLPGTWSDDLLASVESRSLWSRFGL
jgi:serine protease SohB